MVKRNVRFGNQSVFDLFFADLDQGFQFVPEGPQVSFLFSGQHLFVGS
jgi:hypothetical protein